MTDGPKKSKSGWFVIAIVAVIIAAIAIWAVEKKPTRPAERPAQPELHTHELTNGQAESEAEPAEPAVPKTAAIKDIINAATTWRPKFAHRYGKPAPDFTVTDIDGKEHKLSAYRGKNVMIIFWATWCPPCRMEIPHLIELRKTVSEDKLAMLAISIIDIQRAETPEKVKTLVKDSPINYTVISTDISTVPAPFNLVTGIPASFFIDPQGNIKLAVEGLISLPEIKAILQAR